MPVAVVTSQLSHASLNGEGSPTARATRYSASTPRTVFVRRSENAQRQKSSTDEGSLEKRSWPVNGRAGLGISQPGEGVPTSASGGIDEG